MHPDDGIPLLFRHVEGHAVAQDAGIADDDVEPPERLYGLVHQTLSALPIGHVVIVGGRLPAGADDLVDRLLRRPVVVPAAVPLAAEVVDDDSGALPRQQSSVAETYTAGGAGDDRHLSVEPSHCGAPSCG